MAKKHVVVSEDRWDAARHVLDNMKREARRLDVNRIMAAAGEMITAYSLKDDALFADALKRIVCHGYDASPKPKDWQGG